MPRVEEGVMEGGEDAAVEVAASTPDGSEVEGSCP